MVKVIRAALLILIGAALLALGYKIIDGPIKREQNRSFSYFLTLQRMRGQQLYQEAIRSHGEETYDKGDRFRVTVSTPNPAYLYIFKDSPPEANEGFRMIYPQQRINNGSASIGADQPFESDWFIFTGPAGSENFWIVWSTSPVAELDSVTSEAFKRPDGSLTGPTLVAVKQYLAAKKAETDATTYNYNANKTAVVRAKRDLIVALAQFRHR